MNKQFLISLIQRAANTPIKNDEFSMDMSGHSLVLVTAAGTIVGTPLLKCDESDLKELAVDAFFYTLGEAYSEKTNENSFILLKDAVLNTGSCNISYKFLYVFTDDVIAATIGNINCN